MRPNRIALILALFVGLPPAEVAARELYGPEAGVIPYGMGRAYSAVADDWLALHYNPAGLALVDGVDLQLTDLKLGINKSTGESYGDFKDLDNSSSDSQRLEALSGKQVYANVSNISQLTIPRFAIAMIYDTTVSFDSQNLIYPQYKVRYTKDFGFVTGTGIGIGKTNNRQKALRIGASLKYLKRVGGTKDIKISELGTSSQAFLDQFQQSGWGIGASVGMQYQIPVNSRVEYTVSYAYHDIGNTSFGTFTNRQRPSPIEENMVAGMMIRFPIGGAVNRRLARRYGQPRSSNHLTFSADYSHINLGTDKEQIGKHLHFGVNLDLPILSFQAGMNQGSITYGFGVDLYAIRIAAASYAEELGSFAGQRPDRRYLLSIGTGFGFDSF